MIKKKTEKKINVIQYFYSYQILNKTNGFVRETGYGVLDVQNNNVIVEDATNLLISKASFFDEATMIFQLIAFNRL